ALIGGGRGGALISSIFFIKIYTKGVLKMQFTKGRLLKPLALTMSAMFILSAYVGADGEANDAEHDINVVQGFDPGGGSDQLAQVTQPYLEEYLETTITNEYIPGAAGAVAWARIANQAENDGYTISITNGPMLMTNYIMNEEIS